MSKIPYVEFYRPKKFDEIVLDSYNKKILKNIITSGIFPNLLFYGPPGTGKTTTIINLINAYQEKYTKRNSDLIIHLNASDERGIDIIRNQINSFVNSKPLFNTGLKFVILDEVDYMTKTAQQALKYLLHNFSNSVRFCLICNYISKIDEGLQNEFILLRFNQLPKDQIISFLKNISNSEKLNLTDEILSNIQKIYDSDIRSMINFIQYNQDSIHTNSVNIVENYIWSEIVTKINNKEKLTSIYQYIQDISLNYNIDKKNIIKHLLNYIIETYPEKISEKFLNSVENLIHSQTDNSNNYVYYCISKLYLIF